MHNKIKVLTILLFSFFSATAYVNALAEDAAFFKAVYSGNTSKAEALLNKGANVNTKIKQLHNSPILLVSLLMKHDDTTIMLLKHGANPNFEMKKGKSRFSPLHLAIKMHKVNIAKAMIDAGADLEATDEYGTKPLHLSATENQNDIAKYILAKGGKIDTRDNKNRTALHWASFFGYMDVVKTLVKNGADINAKSVEGYTPLHAAEMKDNKMVAEFIKSHGGKE